MTRIEEKVLRGMLAGWDTKQISVELGLSLSTISGHMQAILKREGLTKAEFTARYTQVFVGPLPRISPTLLDILRRTVKGESSAYIAKARATTERAVNVQIATGYRLLGVHSKAELAAKYGARLEAER